MNFAWLVAVFAAAFSGALVGGMVGLYLGSQSMIVAVKKAFGPDA